MPDQAASTPPLVATDLFCPQCGYNLRGTGGERCSECGRTFAPGELSGSRIPWAHRRMLGRRKAFFRTLHIATFHPGRLAESFDADIPWREGRRFRLLCVLPLCLAWLLIPGNAGRQVLDWMTSTPMSLFNSPQGPTAGWWLSLAFPWCRGMDLWWVRAISLLGLALASGMVPVRVMSFTCWPEPFRNRVLAASQYLTVALWGGCIIGMAISVAIWTVACALHRVADPLWLVQTLAAVVPPVGVLVWMASIYRFRRQAVLSTGTPSRQPTLAGLLVLLITLVKWAVVAPWCAGLVATMIRSLRG